MRKQGTDRFVRFGAAVLAVALAGVLAAAAARTEGSPAPSPDPSPSPVPAVSPEPAGAPPAGEELPRIIRTVCTDRVCGGCDGKCCASSGHVAVDKKGRCCCTPTDGSALDRAIRQAYQRHPPL